MTFDIALVLSIVALAVLLFVTERIRVDLVALLVLGSLALTGLVTPTEALSGFSNPAVVTVWAVFILSSALSRTGVANVVGHQVLRLAGPSELSLLTVIMLTAAVLSAFMNNVGVAALLLPVVMDIARRTGRPPSRLLIPLAFGSLLGGLTTLIGTPPNILISDILRDYGLQPFQLFDYSLAPPSWSWSDVISCRCGTSPESSRPPTKPIWGTFIICRSDSLSSTCHPTRLWPTKPWTRAGWVPPWA